MIFIGDVHGKIDEYNELTGKYPHSIQVGDLGFRDDYARIKYRPNHYMIMGNHDDYDSPPMNSIGDYGVFEKSDRLIYFIRGAYSIDQAYRREGLDWFRQEELSYQDFSRIAEEVKSTSPEIIVSHACPKRIVDGWYNDCRDLTSQGLDYIFSCYKPKHWVFGHHHVDWSSTIDGTQFTCLNELSVLEI